MHLKKKVIFLLTLCLMFCSLAIGSFGEESQITGSILYVDSANGNDETGDGSEANPYKSFKVAITHSSANDTIYLKKGTYDAMPLIPVGSGSGASANSGIENFPSTITIEGENLLETTIKDLQFGPINNGQTVTIKNVTIESTTGSNFVYMGYYGSQSSIDLTLVKCLSKNTTGKWNRRWIELFGNLSLENTVVSGNSGYGFIMNYNSPIERFTIKNSMLIGSSSRGIIDANTNVDFTNTILIGDTLHYIGSSTFTNCIFDVTVTDAPITTYALEYDENFNITNYQDVWQNTGIGTNPDETQANIGVYGGQNAWGEFKISDELTLDIEAPKYEVDGGTTFDTYAVIKGANNIYAEDFTINYDSNLFELVGAEVVNADGLKIYYSSTSEVGKARYIISSIKEENGLNDSANILKITFKAKNLDGSGDIKINSGLAANGNGLEITPILLGKTFTVNKRTLGDVNKDGKFTLGDLAIAGRLYASNSSNWTPFEPDVDSNGSVEDLDLSTIVKSIIDTEIQ